VDLFWTAILLRKNDSRTVPPILEVEGELEIVHIGFAILGSHNVVLTQNIVVWRRQPSLSTGKLCGTRFCGYLWPQLLFLPL